MARRMFPNDRLVYSLTGAVMRGAVGQTATVYSNAGGSALASILNEDGSANASSTLTVDAYSRLPLFQGPTDGTDTLYVSVGGGPVVALYARVDDRIDEVKATADAATTAAAEAQALADAAVTPAELTTAVAASETTASGTYLPLLTDPGVAWSTGAASVRGQVWTYGGGRYVDTTGATTLPAAPSTPRFVFLGVDTTGVGNVILTSAENVTGVATTTSGTARSDVAGCSISVPASTRPVVIQFRAAFTQNGAGEGTAYLTLYETTAGSTGDRRYAIEALPGVAGGTSSAANEFDLGTTATAKTYKLQISVAQHSGTPTVSLINAAAHPTSIKAETR